MRTGMILILGGILYCLLCWIRDRPGSALEMLVSIGGGLPKRLIRCFTGRVREENAAYLFAQRPIETRRTAYVKMQFGLWITVTLATGLLVQTADLILKNQTQKEPQKVETTLERPEFNASDQELVYEVNAEKDGELYTRTVTIEVPKKEPDTETVEKLLDQAQSYVEEYFSNYPENGETWPDFYQDTVITCVSKSSDWIDHGGKIQWEAIKEPVTARIQVQLSAFGKDRQLLVFCPISPKEETIQQEVDRMIQRLQQGEFLTETTLFLPETGENQVKYQWNVPSQKRQVSRTDVVFWIIILPIGLLIWYKMWLKEKLKNRKKRIYRSYPDMLNKMMILMGSGMSAVKAWETITEDYRKQKEQDQKEEPLYEEMQQAENRFHNGIAFSDAVRGFADRIRIQEVSQFAAILQSSWRRGDDHVLMHMRELHDRSWEIRKNQIRKQSEEADTKLLLPLILMLIVVMIIVLTPALMTMTV